MGLASRHGVFAAHLAHCGFGGPPEIFEGKYPLGKAFTGQWNESELFDGLGERFKMMELYFKLYACCAFIHPSLDGLLDIMSTDGVRAADIDRMSVRFPKSGYKIIDNNPLRSHCAQYVLALATWRGYVEFYDILNDQRSDERIQWLSERVEVIGDEETDRTYPDLYRSIIAVYTKDGQRHVRDIVHPKGSPEHPVSRAVLEAKFNTLTKGILAPERLTDIAKAVDRMEDLSNIAELTSLLAGS
jgi:2-methylcitrate dehydratase PrpD